MSSHEYSSDERSFEYSVFMGPRWTHERRRELQLTITSRGGDSEKPPCVIDREKVMFGLLEMSFHGDPSGRLFGVIGRHGHKQ